MSPALDIPGPGLPTDPDRMIQVRWAAGQYRYAWLVCGHRVRIPRTEAWPPEGKVPCSMCRREEKDGAAQRLYGPGLTSAQSS